MFMKSMNVTQAALAESIKKLSLTPMSDDEAAEGARNLAGFFQTLIEIEREQQRGKEDGNNGSTDRLHQA